METTSLAQILADALQHPNTLQEFQDAGYLPRTSLEDAFGHVSGESDEVPIQNGEGEGSLVNPLDDAGIKTPMVELVAPSDSSTRVDSSVSECQESISAMFVGVL